MYIMYVILVIAFKKWNLYLRLIYYTQTDIFLKFILIVIITTDN